MTRYELLERIGVGAVAEMFRGKAVAAGGFEKPVAIKRILPHLGQDRRFVQALMAEAKILSQLRHRNIVQIFDVGLGDDGQYFLVMEFVEGMGLDGIQRTLESRRKRLPLDIALHVGAEICEALEHAHTAKAPDGKPMRLVHRDVAPSNVLVSRHGEVKITDFGLARRPGEATGHGVRGKFGYVSPEVASGGVVDPRSDVFSAATMIYELALGRRLFSHLPDLDAVSAVIECKVPRPRDIDPGLPAKLDEILMSALVKDPARRVGSAGKFGADLRSLRYSLDASTGDPAQELARIVIGVGQASDGPGDVLPADPRQGAARRRRTPVSSAPPEFAREPTVVSLTAIDEFSDDRDGTGLIKARAVLDRFEEEETRLASSPGMSFDGGRWRQQQDSFEVPVGPRETQPTEVFGLRAGTGDGTPRADTDAADESTKVLSPAQLARRIRPDDADESTRMVQPRGKLSPPATPRLPGLAGGKARSSSLTKPPPVPPPPTPRATGSRPPQPPPRLEIEANIPARTATPTVPAQPAGPVPGRSSSMPVVAGFGAKTADLRRWLIIAAIALAIIGLGIVAALLK